MTCPVCKCATAITVCPNCGWSADAEKIYEVLIMASSLVSKSIEVKVLLDGQDYKYRFEMFLVAVENSSRALLEFVNGQPNAQITGPEAPVH